MVSNAESKSASSNPRHKQPVEEVTVGRSNIRVGRPRKGWEPLNTRISPEAKTRLLAHRRLHGVEMGEYLTALILTHVDPIPEELLPPIAFGDGVLGPLLHALASLGLSAREAEEAVEILGKVIPPMHPARGQGQPFQKLLEEDGSDPKRLRIALRYLKACPGLAPFNEVEWIKLRALITKAIKTIFN